ncbi:MAG: tetratricopeptide repeat protein [Prevotella sp.]|nr:tetratricopeptide repeat protein [Prevotella sp.]
MAKTITYITTLTLLLALAAGCRRTATPTPFTDAERAAVDSMLRPATTVDSLLTMIDRFALDGNQLGQIVAYRQLGKLYREQNHFDRAIDCHNRSINLALACADTMELIQAYNNIGTNYRRMSEHDEASQFHILAARLSNEIADQDNPATLKNKVVSLNGLGNVYLSIGMLEMADSVLRLALDGERRLGSALGQAINMANLGAIKEQLGQTDSAWHYYRESLRLNEEAGSTLGLSLCHSHFGDLYERDGRLDEALDEYLAAYQLMADSPDDWHRLESALSMVRLLIKLGRLSEARQYLDAARATAERHGSTEHRAEVESLFADLYEKMGQTRLALDHYKTARTLSDSVLNLQTVNQIQNMSLNLERSRRQHELSQAEQDLQLERSARRLTLMTAIVILLLAASIIAFMWYHYRARLNRQHMMQQMQQTREAFFTNITHEFRTPLTVILGLGQQLEDQDIDDMSQVRSSAKMIVRQGNSLLGLINQLLDISKVRSAIGQPKWRHADIIAYITMVVDNFRPYADSKRQELTFTHSLTSLQMDFVPDYVQRIVTNLVANAIKYTPTYGRINVTFEQSGQSRVKLQVFDTGQGIPAGDLPHIFDAFFQGENHGGDIGTGIGLSLVRVMTEAMNGTVSATSIPGQGSTFTVLLPLHADRRHQPVGSDDRQPTPTPLPFHMGDDTPLPDDAPAETQPAEQRRILIVEDNQDIAFYIGMHLQADSQLLYAHTGEEGLKKARDVVPDLIITDIMMPGDMNGLELCRRIRSDELLSHIPIIIITAKTTEADRVSGLQAGADAYLVKPFNSDELLIRVDKLMERQRLMRQRYAQTADADAPASDDNLTAADRQWMNRLVDTVYRLMAKGTVDMETIAGEMAISRAQMNRKLLALTGQNASTYIMRLRLARAKRLLKGDPTMPVGDVALRCGFDDVAYFSRVFKQTFEMTPSQYRRNI